MASRPRPKSFNLPLNGFRGLCALMVFVYHVANANIVSMDAYGTASELALSSLRYGVELFFLISGYVISSSLVRHATLGAFLRDRVIRIYTAWVPLITLVALVCATMHLKMFEHTTPLQSLGLYLANLFLLPPLVPVPLVHAVSWSLTYEWLFYLAAASGVILLRRRREARWSLALWALTVALFVSLFPRALFFIPGVIVFTYRDFFEGHRKWLRLPIVSFLLFALTWRMTGADKAELTPGMTLFDWALDGRLLYALVAFVASIHMFASVTLRVTSEFAVLETRAFQFLGKVSYSFYLWHLLVVAVMKRAMAPIIERAGAEVGVVCVAIGTLALSLPLAWASWQLLEVRLAKVIRTMLAPAPVVMVAADGVSPSHAPAPMPRTP